MYDIVAVSVNYKMKEKILEMLRSLFLDIASTSLSVQVVVVDNASGDGIARAIAVEFPQVRCIENTENLGFGAANNLVLRAFDARYFFLINPDIVFPTGQGVFEKMFVFMEAHPKIGLTAPKLILGNGVVQYSSLRFPGFWDHPLYRLGVHDKYSWANRRVARLLMTDFNREKTLPVDWATGAALFVRAKALKHIGAFDERFFMYYEDCDLCRRFWQAGWPVYYKGDIVLSHGYERASAKVPGFKSLWQNRLTRTHFESLVKYWWKWKWKGVS
ncbi:MAG: glycosyltransferase family 2 protein [Patescibacteria group bacterium]